MARFDLYKYLLGEETDRMNPIVKNNDQVIIGPYQARVKVFSPLRRQGLYEVLPEENLGDLLKHVGGFDQGAYQKQVIVTRNDQDRRAIFTVPDSLYNTFSLQNGDELAAFRVLDQYKNRVQITGAVPRPGYYQLQDSLFVTDLIAQAGGLREEAYVGRALIKSQQPDYTYLQRSFHVGKVLRGEYADILLKNADVIQIFSQPNLIDAPSVLIQGEVRNPARYAYSKGMTLRELILQAGGFTYISQGTKVEVATKGITATQTIIKTYTLTSNFEVNGVEDVILQPYDEVFVRKEPDYSKPAYVMITGEVLYPGVYALQSSKESLSSVLARAGGVTPNAYTEGSSLHRSFRNRMFDLLDTFLADSVRLNVTDLDVVRIELAQQLWRLAYEQETRRTTNANIKSQGFFTKEYTQQSASQMYAFVNSLNIRQDSLLTHMLSVLSSNYPVDIQLDEILKNKEYDVVLRDGDRLHVPAELRFVRVQAGVNNPTAVMYNPSWSMRQYVRAAGGFHPSAKASRLYVRYANGSIRSTRRFIFRNYPDVLPGSEIIVPLRVVRRRQLSTTELIAITSTLTSMAILIGNFVINARN